MMVFDAADVILTENWPLAHRASPS